MFKQAVSQIVVALAVAAFGLTLVASSVEASGGGKKAGRVEGTLTAVGAASVTITTRGGQAVTVDVGPATKIERNDRHVRLSALKIGDRAEARFDPATHLASKVESVGP